MDSILGGSVCRPTFKILNLWLKAPKGATRQLHFARREEPKFHYVLVLDADGRSINALLTIF